LGFFSIGVRVESMSHSREKTHQSHNHWTQVMNHDLITWDLVYASLLNSGSRSSAKRTMVSSSIFIWSIFTRSPSNMLLNCVLVPYYHSWRKSSSSTGNPVLHTNSAPESLPRLENASTASPSPMNQIIKWWV